ncbi:DUF4179 domain-containing protein [Romboutsia weinsteinii]|uniref:DUF4179 domain-containing protein n=1 Tax=Romboutsia weinsteinii TaxID=2020949 RepID=A0A255IF84_9FIRM|nr:DUF4179 domain-containing protein [Romboutsia weinsteinii]RDY29373.1 DUF4179 domain-containing protein [Romboutsia weinsteinii]
MRDTFKILNDVKVDIDEYKEVKFDDNTELKKKMKKQIKSRDIKYKRGIAIASLALVLGSGFIMNEKAWANVKNIWYTLSQVSSNKENEIKDSKYNINKVISDKNVDILFRNIILDDHNLIIDMNIDDSRFDPRVDFTKKQHEEWYVDKWSDKETTLSLGADSIDIHVDGKKLSDFGMSSAPESTDRKSDNTTDVLAYQSIGTIGSDDDEYYREIDENQFPHKIENDKIYNLKITVKKIHISHYSVDDKGQPIAYGGAIRGNWTLDLDIKGKDLKNQTITYDINKNIELDIENELVNLNLENLKISPLKLKLNYKLDKDVNCFTQFKVLNDKGEEYQKESVSGSKYVKAEYGNIFNDTKYVILIPFIEDFATSKITEFKDKSIKILLDK